jgi:hypothetical protein
MIFAFKRGRIFRCVRGLNRASSNCLPLRSGVGASRPIGKRLGRFLRTNPTTRVSRETPYGTKKKAVVEFKFASSKTRIERI